MRKLNPYYFLLFSGLFFFNFFPKSALGQVAGSGSALTFDGTSTYVSVPNNASLNSDSAITVEAWINANSWATNIWQGTIVGKDGWGSGEAGYNLRCGANGSLSFNIGTTTSWKEAASTSIMATGRWYHVAGTFDGAFIRLYINGMLMDSTAYSGLILSSTYDVNIGRIPYTAGGQRIFNGKIDQVRIWRDAVSQNDLRTWMCNKNLTSHPNLSRLMAYWNLDEGTGSTVADLSGNGNTGTLVSGPVWGVSGAPIGDASMFDYNAPHSLVMNGLAGDSIRVSVSSGSPNGIHLYRVDQAPNLLTPPVSFSLVDTNQYYGVFIAGGTNPTYQASHYYDNTAFAAANGVCWLGTANRGNNAATSWTDANAAQNTTAGTLIYTSTGFQNEWVLGVGATAAISANGPTSICIGDTVGMSLVPIPGFTYQWLSNGSSIPGATNSNYSTNTAGSYALILNGPGCTDTTAAINVTVNNLPFITVPLFVPMCINDSAQQLIVAPAGGVFYGPVGVGGLFDPLLSGVGVHTVIYEYTDSNSCTASDTIPVQVFPAPTVIFQGPTTLCENAGLLPLTSATPSGGTYTGTGVIGNDFDPMAAGVGTHTVYYEFMDTNGCSDDDSASYIVLASPATPTVSQVGDTLYSSASSGNQWYSSAMGLIPGETNQSYFPGLSGTYWVTVTDSNNCISDSSLHVNYIYVGIAENEFQQLSIFPNPAQGLVGVRFQASAFFTGSLEVCDTQGKVVWKQQVEGQSGSYETQLDLGTLPDGMYLVKVRVNDQQAVYKLILQD